MQKNCFKYPVKFVEDVFGESHVLAQILVDATGSETPRVLIVADVNTVLRQEGIGAKIGRYVQRYGISLAGSPVVIPGGERVKADSLKSAAQVISAILKAKLGRNDVVLALGGGTVIDVAGYAAAQVRGGVKILRVPTTPAAMMDAAFADYAAVDSSSVKDALQVSSQPVGVVIDTSLATSVLEGVWRAGISEAVRLGMASDAELVEKVFGLAKDYRARRMPALDELVRAAVATRGKLGPTSLGLWAALRLESMSGYKLPHGYALGIGLCIDLGYAAEKGLLKAETCDRIVELLKASGALEGLTHSAHLLGDADGILEGLDAWALATGDTSLCFPAEIGKTVREETPDRDVMRRAIEMMKNKLTPPATA